MAAENASGYADLIQERSIRGVTSCLPTIRPECSIITECTAVRRHTIRGLIGLLQGLQASQPGISDSFLLSVRERTVVSDCGQFAASRNQFYSAV
jgi:hypothetical protein